ncbi:hypothetical protein [Atopobium sp. oral taxon 810]|uniref:hypothetical protein n=1 Tax=Atopobium sp. oral taxon 810 TaxID=712158 RepID=UPI00041E1844|nr:hypothetical protein [Atopobium sp. oral taxon 810]
MNVMLTITLILMVVLFAVDGFFRWKQKKQLDVLLDKLTNKLAAHDYDGYDALLDSSQQAIPPFNFAFMKLQGAAQRGEVHIFKQRLATFDKLRLNNRQKAAIASVAFTFYTNRDSKADALVWLDVINSLPGEERLKKEAKKRMAEVEKSIRHSA